MNRNVIDCIINIAIEYQDDFKDIIDNKDELTNLDVIVDILDEKEKLSKIEKETLDYLLDLHKRF